MDPLATSISLVALILGAAIGWLAGRSRSTTAIAELNANLVLERRLNKQLGETVQVDAVRSLIKATDPTAPGELTREPTAVSG
jgi:hypothetical protein